MYKWANVCIYSKFIQLTFSSVYIYIHTYSKYRKVTTENTSTVRIVFWKNIQNCLTGYLALLPTYFKSNIVWILLYLCFNTTLIYSQLYKSIFHFLVNIDWQSTHVTNTYTLGKTSVVGFTHFDNWMSRHNNININFVLIFNN